MDASWRDVAAHRARVTADTHRIRAAVDPLAAVCGLRSSRPTEAEALAIRAPPPPPPLGPRALDARRAYGVRPADRLPATELTQVERHGASVGGVAQGGARRQGLSESGGSPLRARGHSLLCSQRLCLHARHVPLADGLVEHLPWLCLAKVGLSVLATLPSRVRRLSGMHPRIDPSQLQGVIAASTVKQAKGVGCLRGWAV